MKNIQLEILFKLRLSVARFGEMDGARWWNTQGILGRYGTLALSRGLPKTHHFAQARIAFAVADQRCKEIYPRPSICTLWDLQPEIEDRFNQKWHDWINEADLWAPVFNTIQNISGLDLPELILKLDLATHQQIELVKKLNRSDEGNSVKIPENGSLDEQLLVLLAAGFSLGESGKPAVPYLPIDHVRL